MKIIQILQTWSLQSNCCQQHHRYNCTKGGFVQAAMEIEITNIRLWIDPVHVRFVWRRYKYVILYFYNSCALHIHFIHLNQSLMNSLFSIRFSIQIYSLNGKLPVKLSYDISRSTDKTQTRYKVTVLIKFIFLQTLPRKIISSALHQTVMN